MLMTTPSTLYDYRGAMYKYTDEKQQPGELIKRWKQTTRIWRGERADKSTQTGTEQ